MNFYSNTFEVNAIVNNSIETVAKIMASQVKDWISSLNIKMILSEENTYGSDDSYRHQLFYNYPGILHYIRIHFHTSYSSGRYYVYYGVDFFNNSTRNDNQSYSYSIEKNKIFRYSFSILTGNKSVFISPNSKFIDSAYRLCFFNTYDKNGDNIVFVSNGYNNLHSGNIYYDNRIDSGNHVTGSYSRIPFTDISLDTDDECFLIPFFFYDGNSSDSKMRYKVDDMYYVFGKKFIAGSKYSIDGQKYYCVRAIDYSSIMVKLDN